MNDDTKNKLQSILQSFSRKDFETLNQLRDKEIDGRVQKKTWWKAILIQDKKYTQSFRLIDAETQELIVSARRECDILNYASRLRINVENKMQM